MVPGFDSLGLDYITPLWFVEKAGQKKPAAAVKVFITFYNALKGKYVEFVCVVSFPDLRIGI